MAKEKFYQKTWFMWVLLVFLPPIGIIFMWATKKEMTTGKKVIFTIIGLIWWLIVMAVKSADSDGGTTETNAGVATTERNVTTAGDVTETATTEAATETKALESYEVELAAGHYTAGVDIPEGTYNLKCISGSGNVTSTNMFSGGLNEIMSLDTSDGYSIDSFSNAKFSSGDVLSLSSTVVVKLTTEAADTGSLTARTPSGKEIELSSGNFVAGTDFEVGTYDITCTAGQGNVNSDNMFDGGLNEILTTDASSDMGITMFKNATFEEGNTLTVSGCTIKLTPSK
ncbi:MAG: hypothetical protein K2I10_11765 [Lachnospiraceae bacterium]|nr:hypothetical protein [Lachnospiraceae bacterium]